MKESEKKYKYLDLIRAMKKTMEHESDGGTNCNWNAQDSHQSIDKGTRVLENKRTSGDHPNVSIINAEKSPGDLRRLSVFYSSSRKPLAKASVKNSQRSKRVIINVI